MEDGGDGQLERPPHQWPRTCADVLADRLCTGRGPQSGNSKLSHPRSLAGKPLLPQQLVLPFGPQKPRLVLECAPICLLIQSQRPALHPADQGCTGHTVGAQ